MAGVHSGVQRRIRDEIPKAVYVHCTNHSLNLALQDTSARVHCIRDVLSFVNDLATFFRDSAKRTAVFETVLANMNQDPKSRLTPLCPTRWTVRSRAIRAVLQNYEAIMQALEELSEEPGPTGAKAAGFLSKLLTFEIFLGLNISYDVFSITEQLATALQSKQMTLTAAKVAALNVVSELEQMRTDGKFDSAWQKVCQTATDLDLHPPVMPRKRRAPRRLDDGVEQHVHADCATKHKIETWYALLDTVSNEIRERFSQDCFQHVADIENVLIRAAGGLQIANELMQIFSFYADDFDFDMLEAQLKIFRNLFLSSAPATLADIVTALKSTEGVNLLLFEHSQGLWHNTLFLLCYRPSG